ncbi:MAG: hypothetical protein RLY86_1492 [Pseudomonadota bacterium]|jgi:putative transposase
MKRPPPPVQASDEAWALARAREPVIRKLAEADIPYGARTELVAAAAAELGLTRSYLYRLMKAYTADPRTRSLLPRAPGPAIGRRFLDPRVEAIIKDEIENNYLKQLQPKKAKLVKDIHARCHGEGLQRPARRTVLTRLAEISKREQLKRRRGPKAAADKFDPVLEACAAGRPLEIVQIDHTPADVIAVEEETGEPIGRPHVSLAVDVCTRMYGGFYLTFDPPSATSVACCLLHTVMDKSTWLTTRGLPAAWPVQGLPETVHVDNAKEFHSRAFIRACEDYGIEVQYRPVRRPKYGGHVERRIGHLSQELHLLDGTTFSNIKERGAYDSMGKACLTISEIEWMVASIILEHQASFHEGIQTSPQARWMDLTASMAFRMPPNLRDFHRDFLPWQERRMQRDGIHLFGIRYWHDALVGALNNEEKLVVHYNPADMSKLYVRGASGGYLEVPYRNLRRPAISVWEHRAAVRALRRQGRAGVDEEMIFSMVLLRRRRLEEIRGSSRKARLELARSGAMPRPAMLPPPNHVPPVSGDTDRDEDRPLELPFYETEVWDE